jgi:hypothetical protein
MIRGVLANRDIETHCPLCGRPFARVESSEEHIFPKWLQRHHNLWTRRLTIPNFLGKSYKSVKIRACAICNNIRYGKKETVLARLLHSADSYAECAAITDDALAIWLGKITWLLCRKSHSVEDFRTRNQPHMDRIIPHEIIPGTLYLGMIQRAFATKKGMLSCYVDDPFDPTLFVRPYSFYRFRIDTRDNKFETFDFVDNVGVLGAAIRSNNIGLVCVFDGGLHKGFRAQRFNFLNDELLHPMQFNEVVAKIFYDQTVLDERACKVTYFWNVQLRSVIAMHHAPRFYNPYLQVNDDPKRFAAFLGQYTFSDPDTIISGDGSQVFTSLQDHNGAFLRYAVTDEEIEAARRDSNQVVRGPLNAAWRQTPLAENRKR